MLASVLAGILPSSWDHVDGFDVDTSALYTAVGTWTYDVANSRVSSASSGASFLCTALSSENAHVELTCSQGQQAGAYLRYKDASNYYYVDLRDDTSNVSANLAVVKRVAASNTTLVSLINLAWTRGTSKTFLITMTGATIDVYMNGALATSITDPQASITGAGKYGLRSNAATNIYGSLKILRRQ